MKNKFDDLKHRIEVGAERFNQCEEFAKKLIGGDSPYVAEIEKRQEQLRYTFEVFTKMLDVHKLLDILRMLSVFSVFLRFLLFYFSYNPSLSLYKCMLFSLGMP